jgi:hypothetical protein
MKNFFEAWLLMVLIMTGLVVMAWSIIWFFTHEPKWLVVIVAIIVVSGILASVIRR